MLDWLSDIRRFLFSVRDNVDDIDAARDDADIAAASAKLNWAVECGSLTKDYFNENDEVIDDADV